MDPAGLYAILNSRLLSIILIFNVGLVSLLILTSELPRSLGIVLQERLSEYRYLRDTDEIFVPNLTTYKPTVSQPSPDWLIAALNDDDLPCTSLPPPVSGIRHGYSYPPSTSSHQRLQSKYLPFQYQPRTSPLSLRSDLNIAESCIDSAISTGILCNSNHTTKLDVVWTFANGSGILHEKWRRVRETQQRLQRSGTLAPRARALLDTSRASPVAGTEKKLFRDHDELRHSIRSVLQHFRQHTDQFHIVTSDFAFPSCNPDEFAGWRLGQIPQWLDLRQPFDWKDGNVRLNVVHHAGIFDNDYKYTTFNSLAIESQFAYLNVSDVFVYLNDDFYFSADLSPWDFYTPSYGIVLRMQSDLLVSSLVDGARPSSGEWHSLEFSNRLLSDRFGLRKRPYVVHEAKAFRRSIFAEISLIWAQELAATSSHPFRTDPKLRDAHMGFIAAHFIVERWREGLLWSWIVARLGGKDDEWDAVTSEQAWMELGGKSETPNKRLFITLPKRESLSSERLEAAAAVPGQPRITRNTKYSFTSQDGYPYTFLGYYGSRYWPQFKNPFLQCQIEFNTCFPSEFTNASEVFKHIAFVAPKCGDCIINALVGASGPLGLSAFLPNPTHGLKSTQESVQDPVPHLPLVSDYKTGDFSLRGVLGDSMVDIRAWTVRMLQRYRFVIGDTPSVFAMVKDVTTAEAAFSAMDSDGSIALVCLNDDIYPSQAEETDNVLRREQERRWPRAAAWETN